MGLTSHNNIHVYTSEAPFSAPWELYAFGTMPSNSSGFRFESTYYLEEIDPGIFEQVSSNNFGYTDDISGAWESVYWDEYYQGGSPLDILDFGSLRGHGGVEIWVSYSYSSYVEIYGTENGDLINYYSSGGGMIDGGGGDDTLQGGAGSDTLSGGAGIDVLTYAGSTAGVTVHLINGSASGGDAAGDVISGFENLTGSSMDDVLGGNNGINTIFGGAGNDRIYGYAGNDDLRGGAGNDTIGGGDGADKVSGGYGNDSLFGSSGNDTVEGGAGHDWLMGGADADALGGKQGNDRLFGDGGNDRLWGASGSDTLEGGTGNDQLTGGAGNDHFVFFTGDGHDTITDLSAANGEKIDLTEVNAITGFSDLVNNHLENAGGNAKIVYGGSSILLKGVPVSDFGVGKDFSADDFLF